MTSTSEIGYCITPRSALNADTAMSSATARWYANNLCHLVDQSSQFRVNWVALGLSNGQEKGIEGITWDGSGSTWFHVITHVFPVCRIGTDSAETSYSKPVNLVVSVAGYTENSDELFFRAVVQPSLKRLSYDFDDDSCLAYFEDSTTSNTAEWVIDSDTASLYPDNVQSQATPVFIGFEEYDGNNYNVPMYFFRLSIYAKEGYASGSGHLTGVCVKEYQKV